MISQYHVCKGAEAFFKLLSGARQCVAQLGYAHMCPVGYVLVHMFVLFDNKVPNTKVLALCCDFSISCV